MAQKLKKKTVKDLNEDIIQFENKLEKLYNLINVLYAKVAALKKKDEDRPSNPDITSRQPNKKNEDLSRKYSCKKCDIDFESKKTLKVHIKDTYGKEIKCTPS